MTLSTHIRLVDPLPPERVFQFCQTLLGDPDTMLWEHKESYAGQGTMMYANRSGQGYAAMLWVAYHPDGPLPKEDDPDYEDNRPTACIDIMFDTTYGYTGPHSSGCADLHAWLIIRIVNDLLSQYVTPGAPPTWPRFYWQNEFTGEWFDSLENLDSFGDAKKGALR